MKKQKQSARLRRIVWRGGNIMSTKMTDLMLKTAEGLLDGQIPVNTAKEVCKAGNVHQLERKRDCDEHDRGINNENIAAFERCCNNTKKSNK